MQAGGRRFDSVRLHQLVSRAAGEWIIAGKPDWAGCCTSRAVAWACAVLFDGTMFFVSVKRLVRICACRDRVSDPRVVVCSGVREKRVVFGMTVRGLGSQLCRSDWFVQLPWHGWFLCVCLVF